MKANKLDTIGALFWLAVGLLICEESYRFRLGTFSRPGPGFLPFLCGIVLAGLALSVLLRGLRETADAKKDFWEDKSRRPKVMVGVILILAYPALLVSLGFFFATFVLTGLLSKFIYPQKWRTVGVYAFAAALGAYLVFKVALQVEFPQGFLGF